MELNLKNKKILVCGSTSGIGLGIAKSFISEGSNVAITGRSIKKINNLKKKYNLRNNIFFQGDLGSIENIYNLKNSIKKKWKHIDCLILNIGSGKSMPPLTEDHNEWMRMMDVNLHISIKIVQNFIDLFSKKGGSIIFISSICGKELTSAPLAYSSAKIALNLYSKNISKILATKNIRVNTISPGNIMFKGSTWEQKIRDDNNFVKNKVLSQVPLGRFGSIEEIANAVLFLSSKKSSFILGHNLIIDGGQTTTL